MRGSVAKYVLFDSAFWIALLDERDGLHSSAVTLYDKIENWHGLIPWPVLYEVASTRLARDSRKLIRLAAALRSPGLKRIDDAPYRESALENMLDGSTFSRHLSLVDRVLRSILADVNLRIDGLATFNSRDFEDLCRSRVVPILPRDAEE